MKDTLKKTLSVAIIPLMLLGATACSKKEEEVVEEEPTVVVEHEFNAAEAFKEDDGSDIAVLVGSSFDIADYFAQEGYSYSYDGKVDTKTVGEYTITVKAIDSYGMTGTLEKTVQVVSELDATDDLAKVDKITTYNGDSSAKTFTSNNKRYAYETKTSDSGTTVTIKSGTTETKANDGLADSENGSVTDSSSTAGSVSRSDIVVEVKDYLNGTSNMTQSEMEEMEKRHNANRSEEETEISTDELEAAEDGSVVNVTKSKALALENETKIATLKKENAKAVAEENASKANTVSVATKVVGSNETNIKDLASSDFDESVLDKTNSVIAKAYEFVGEERTNFSFDYYISNTIATVLGDGKQMKQVEATTYEIGDTLKYIDENGDYFHVAIYLGNGLALHANWEDSKIGIGPVELSNTSKIVIWHWVER